MLFPVPIFERKIKVLKGEVQLDIEIPHRVANLRLIDRNFTNSYLSYFHAEFVQTFTGLFLYFFSASIKTNLISRWTSPLN